MVVGTLAAVRVAYGWASQDKDKTHDRVQEPCSAVEVSCFHMHCRALLRLAVTAVRGLDAPRHVVILWQKPASSNEMRPKQSRRL
jgi:hypothetical protein